MNFFKALYLESRFFLAGITIVVLFGFSYFIPFLFNFAQILIIVLLTFLSVDLLILFIGKNKLKANRIVPDKFSNGDKNITLNHNKPCYSCDGTKKYAEKINCKAYSLGGKE